MADISQCPSCGTAVAARANACPRCGHPGPFSLYERANRIVWKLLLGCIIAMLIALVFAYQLNWRYR